MSRNNLIKSLSLTAIILSMVACSSLSFGIATPTQSTEELPYCDANSSVLCIISFGVDNKGQLLINFYKPDASIPDFYLRVWHRETEGVYECQAVEDFPALVYCAGERIPLESQIDIEVYSMDNDTLIASGTFVIFALAVATPVIVTVTVGTPRPTSIPSTRTNTPGATNTPNTTTPNTTLTPSTKTPTRTPTVSYRNP